MLDFLPDILRTPVAFVVVLGVLVFVHEFGHYIAARGCGIDVEAFSIGFGRAICSWKDRAGTVWKLAWMPLGGYVRMNGMENPHDATEEERAAWHPGRTFHEQGPGKRAIVIAAGPIANFLLAAVLFTVLFATVGRGVIAPVVGEVLPDSAAAAAGLVAGDRIQTIDGTPIDSFEDIQRLVGAVPGVALKVTVESGGAPRTLTVTPQARGPAGAQVGVLGIRGGAVEYRHVSPVEALPLGVWQTWVVTRDTMVGVWQMIVHARGAEEIGGPLRIAQLSGQVAKLGVASMVSFIALLSVNLGLINLFPIPILDGGHLLFIGAEAVRGRPLSPRAQEVGLRAGLALLVALFVFATFNDLTQIGIFRWVAGLIG